MAGHAEKKRFLMVPAIVPAKGGGIFKCGNNRKFQAFTCTLSYFQGSWNSQISYLMFKEVHKCTLSLSLAAAVAITQCLR